MAPQAPRGALWVSKCHNGVVYLTSVMVVVCLIIVLYFQPRRRVRASFMLGGYCRVKVLTNRTNKYDVNCRKIMENWSSPCF